VISPGTATNKTTESLRYRLSPSDLEMSELSNKKVNE